MDTEVERLEAMKAKMTAKQRMEMAEIIQNELKRREQESSRLRFDADSKVKKSSLSGALDRDGLADMYSLTEGRLRQKLQPKSKMNWSAPRLGLSGNTILMYSVMSFGVLKILLTTGVLETEQAQAEAMRGSQVQQLAIATTTDAPKWSETDKQLLTALDARRVELEKREKGLDEREFVLQSKEHALAERLAELRSLTTKLDTLKATKDHNYEARMEQLAGVYGSMAPNEAAPLISKLDDQIALNLLKRLPGKRMGQILSLMDPQRAIGLTKLLTDINDV